MFLSKGLEVGRSLLVSFLVVLLLLSSSDGIEGVKLLHESSVLEGVLLLEVVGNLGGLDKSELGLNLSRVNDSGKISAGHDVSGKDVSVLLDVFSSVVTEDVVE